MNLIHNQFILTPLFLDEPLPELKSLAGPGWIINEPTMPRGDRMSRVSAINEALARHVQEAIASGGRPVSIAGDCLGAIGVLAGLERAGLDPFLIWFDAHGDFNTWETSPSGFLGGMPLAMISGRGDQTITRAVGLRNLAESRIILSDGRDLDPGERVSLRESGVTRLDDPRALLRWPVPEGPLYVHLDTDVIRPEDAPAQNYLAPGGLPVDDLAEVFRHLTRSGRVAAVSLSSWNPKLEQAKLSQRSSLSLLEALIS